MRAFTAQACAMHFCVRDVNALTDFREDSLRAALHCTYTTLQLQAAGAGDHNSIFDQGHASGESGV